MTKAEVTLTSCAGNRACQRMASLLVFHCRVAVKKKQREERKEVARDKRSKGNTSVRGIGGEARGGMNVGEKLISRRSCRCRRTRY